MYSGLGNGVHNYGRSQADKLGSYYTCLIFRNGLIQVSTTVEIVGMKWRKQLSELSLDQGE